MKLNDEAVEAAAKAIYETPQDHLSRDGYDKAPGDIRELYLAEARAALAAALPHLHATPHRPTCGTTYGESCDSYCPTPAIDREALYDVIATVRDASPRRWDDADTWDILAAIEALMRGEAQ